MKEKKEKKSSVRKPRPTDFQPGHPKLGGRKKGTPNKVNKNIRKMLEEQLLPAMENIGSIIASIEDPEKKASVLSQWAGYIIPKYSNTTINADSGRDLSTEEYINELNDNYKKTEIKININSLKIVNND